MIAIIDYDAGNIKSVEKALQYLGCEAEITRDKDVIMNADHVILPGVGAFGDAMKKIRDYDLETVIKDYVATGKPFLGICLGLQLLFKESEESPGVIGLDLIPGKIKRIPDAEGLKIPQIGWNSLEIMPDKKLFKGVKQGSFVYFVHSYYLECDNEADVAATTFYSTKIHASVEHENIFACQFHPEKSSEAGLTILKNFISL
jgi:glutamine amidotransferase